MEQHDTTVHNIQEKQLLSRLQCCLRKTFKRVNYPALVQKLIAILYNDSSCGLLIFFPAAKYFNSFHHLY